MIWGYPVFQGALWLVQLMKREADLAQSVMLESYAIEVWRILVELSLPLLAGLFLAGLLHVLLPSGLIYRALNRPGFMSIFKAVMIGVPLPLCSCGVVPAALGLKREGASNGATTGFLISTPSTGIDSILVSAAFLGWPFAVFKVFAAFVTGIIGGLIADKAVPEQTIRTVAEQIPDGKAERKSPLVEIIHYAIVDLYGAIDRWVIAGILIAAAITITLPDNFFQDIHWAQGLAGMLLMLAVSIPLYVCTTGSVPIAAAFIAAGMPLGTALVFLMAGPATNIATIGAVYRTLGGRLLMVYIGTVIVMSIGFGLGFGFILSDMPGKPIHQHGEDWFGISSAFLVIAITVYLNIRRYIKKSLFKQHKETKMGLTLEVEGMSCQHCVISVKKTLEGVEGVENAIPDLDSGNVIIKGNNLDRNQLAAAVREAGYKVRQI